jgi:hypothetical protein
MGIILIFSEMIDMIVSLLSNHMCSLESVSMYLWVRNVLNRSVLLKLVYIFVLFLYYPCAGIFAGAKNQLVPRPRLGWFYKDYKLIAIRDKCSLIPV